MCYCGIEVGVWDSFECCCGVVVDMLHTCVNYWCTGY